MHKASAFVPDRTGFLRLAAALLVVSIALAVNASAQAQTETPPNPQAPSVVFQDPKGDPHTDEGSASVSSAATPKIQIGIGDSLVFQDPKGKYGTDHKKASAFGFSLHMPIRRTKEWTFLPSYTTNSYSLGSNLNHEMKSFGLDVHWRGRDPGAVYLVLGGGSATVKLNVEHTECGSIFIPVTCRRTDATASSRTAPYVQAGFGIEGDQLGSGPLEGGWFIEARMWRGPYLQPITLANGAPVGSTARTGNALLVAIGFRVYGPAF